MSSVELDLAVQRRRAVMKRPEPRLHAFVSRGPKVGTLLYPHKHQDGTYVVSMSRFEHDYIRVSDPAELLGWLEKGYRLRMSNPVAGVPAPSLIAPNAIYRPVQAHRA